jgi:hypothetical protein
MRTSRVPRVRVYQLLPCCHIWSLLTSSHSLSFPLVTSSLPHLQQLQPIAPKSIPKTPLPAPDLSVCSPLLASHTKQLQHCTAVRLPMGPFSSPWTCSLLKHPALAHLRQNTSVSQLILLRLPVSHLATSCYLPIFASPLIPASLLQGFSFYLSKMTVRFHNNFSLES